MRLAYLGAPTGWYAQDLQRAARGWCQITWLDFEQLTAQVAKGRQTHGATQTSGETVEIDQCDVLLVRGMPLGSLEQVVFRMDVLQRAEASIPVINPPRALEIAIDKYMALVRLADAGFVVPDTVVCQHETQALDAFDRWGGDVVLKPLFGSEGRGITRLQDREVAERAFRLLRRLGAVIYLQRYVDHEGFDLRLLTVGDRVLGMRRVGQGDWRTNLSRGGRAEPWQVGVSEEGLALRAAQAVGAPLCALDLLPARDGTLYALEVNAVPGWRGLAAALNVDISSIVLDYLAMVAGRPRAA